MQISKPPVFVMQVSIRIQNSKFPCNRLQQLWQPLATFGVAQNGRRPHIMHARIPDFHAAEFVACSISFSIVHVGKSSISGCRHLQLHMLNISSQRETVPQHVAQLSLSLASFQVAVCVGPHSHEAVNSEFHAGCDNSGQPQSQTTPEEKPTKMFRGNQCVRNVSVVPSSSRRRVICGQHDPHSSKSVTFVLPAFPTWRGRDRLT